MSITKLKSSELYRVCDPKKLDFSSTADLEERMSALGQDRAISAVELGINIKSKGYNLFCLGPEGTGKTSLVKRILKKKKKERPTPDDWAYVYNFDEPYKPKAISFPAGTATEFAKDIDKLIDEDGIYIALAYATEEAYSDTIIKYGVDDEDIEEDECFGCGICTWKEDITLFVPAELEIVDDESDYGILITKNDNKLEITFAYNESVRFGHGMGYNKIYSIENKFDTGHMLLMKLISEAIVLKD